MRWALVWHVEQERAMGNLIVPMQISERSIPTAEEQGWMVLARDSDILGPVHVPVQSNPRKVVSDDE